MHTHKDFDYDLWKTEENNTVHYWARVKRTGEVTEMSKEVYDFLSSENNRMRYEMRTSKSPVSLDVNADTDIGESASWIIDPFDCIEDLICKMDLEKFYQELTDKQRDLFIECVVNGKSQAEYAQEHNLFYTTVNQRFMAIRKNFEKFYGSTRRNT